jgi:hypothetical protein
MPRALSSNTSYKRPRITSSKAEAGDARDVQRTFGIKESMLYHWWRKGWVEASLIPGTGKAGGKRIFDFASIRALLKKHADSKQTAK